MTILRKILAQKRVEIDELKGSYASYPRVDHKPISMYESFQQSKDMNIIAEFKRASPSKGAIQLQADPAVQAKQYDQSGARAISVLTDEPFFKGRMEDLLNVREAVNVSILNKDFILDEIQIDRARDYGADVVLLIVAALTPNRLAELYHYATELGLEVLMEVHDEAEVSLANELRAPIIGINNRDLKTFNVDLATTEKLSKQIHPDALLISESGMKSTADVNRVHQAGARGILVGETMMRSSNLQQTFDALRIPFREARLQ